MQQATTSPSSTFPATPNLDGTMTTSRKRPLPSLVPGSVDQTVVVFHTNDAALLADHFRIYRHGFLFRLGLVIRKAESRLGRTPRTYLEGGEGHDSLVSFHVLDGDVTTSTENAFREVVTEGGFQHWTEAAEDVWVTPLPSNDRITLVADAPELGIQSQSAIIDTSQWPSAAARSYELWPNQIDPI